MVALCVFMNQALCIFVYLLCYLCLCLLLLFVFPHSLQHACVLVQLCITCNALQTLLALLQYKLQCLQLILLRSALQPTLTADIYSQTRYIFSGEEDTQGQDLCLFLSVWVLRRDETLQEKKERDLERKKDTCITDHDEKTQTWQNVRQ